MSLSIFDTAALLVVLASIFGFANHHLLKLPFAIGMTVSALLASLLIMGIDVVLPQVGLGQVVRQALSEVDFSETLMKGMLGFLLFAGALHVNADDMKARLTPIITLATLGVMISTAIVGFGSHALFGALGVDISLAWCLVFGALISPTDPVAVLGIMKAAGAQEGHSIKVVGESLFNDGVGVVVFTLLVAFAAGPEAGYGAISAASIGKVLLVEVVGGIALGLISGLITYKALKSLNEPNLETLISVALVMGVTFLAFKLHTSAPLACVVAGLFIGNRGRDKAMSEDTKLTLDRVWAFLDEALNAVLFLLIGLILLNLDLGGPLLLAAALAIPLTLAARFISVSLPISLLQRRFTFTPGAIKILTWGGLKGGISVALALSLPPFEGRSVVLGATYAAVLFSIIVQGLTVGTLIKSINKKAAQGA